MHAAGAQVANRPFTVRAFERLIATLSAPAVRRLTVWLLSVALVFKALVPGRLVQRAVLWFIRKEAACCTCDSPHFKFMQRYLDRFERAGTFERARRFLREGPRRQVAKAVDAWLRIGLFGTWRHELFQRSLGLPGVPPRLLTQAQLSLSAGCDLTCEGCYSAQDRSGRVPRREEIAFLVDELFACGAFTVHLVGKGEPFLSRRWALELLDVIEARPHVFFTLATHGGHVDEALAARLGQLSNLVLLVAVDGPEEVHDARRGKGAYLRAHQTFERLRRHGATFGFSCMVSAKSHAALVSHGFISAQAAAGCAVGVYSRYFSAGATPDAGLALSARDLASYRSSFDAAQVAALLPLIDLDEVEEHTGCHSRAGESVYVDASTGQVSPCLRVPLAPQECRVGFASGRRLAQVLSDPYFAGYRRSSGSCPEGCGANLAGERAAAGALAEACAAAGDKPPPYGLDAYGGRTDAVGRGLVPRRDFATTLQREPTPIHAEPVEARPSLDFARDFAPHEPNFTRSETNCAPDELAFDRRTRELKQ